MRTGVMAAAGLVAACGRIDFDPVGNDRCSGNMIIDPGFELDAASWGDDGDATFQRIAGGHTGAFAGRACRNANAGSLDFAVRGKEVLANFAVGARYHVSAWMRSDLATAGAIQFRLHSATDQIEAVLHAGALTPDWTALELDYTIGVAGGTFVLVDFRADNAPPDPSYCVDVDDTCLAAAAN